MVDMRWLKALQEEIDSIEKNQTLGVDKFTS